MNNAPVLRPYQVQLLASINNALLAGYRRLLIVAPTGSGKTVVFAEIIRQELARRRKALVVAHRREIIGQTSNKLIANGVVPGIIMAGVPPRPTLDVQVASIQTMFVRGIRNDKMALPPADIIVVDEAHHTRAASYQKIVNPYTDAIVLGFTATPERGDGRGLGDDYDVIIEGPQVAELIDLGYLVSTRVYAPYTPDLTGVATRGGDYVSKQLAERMDKAKLVGDIVENWLKFGEDRPTVVFAAGVNHSVHLRDRFCDAGIREGHIDGSTPKPERDAALAQLSSGSIRVLSNCMVLCEGWDQPEVGCCILARPTKSHGLFRQMIGRVLRPAPRKTDAIIIDHAGCVFRHGFAEDHIEWTLSPDDKAARNATAENRSDRHGSRIVECSNCSALRVGGAPCPACGFLPETPPRFVVTADGELGLVDRERHVASQHWPTEERLNFYGQLMTVAQQNGYKPGWAAHKYREKFGTWPPRHWDPPDVEPTPAVRAWVKSRLIAWAKSQRGAA